MPLRGNINVLMGSGANIVVLSGSEGKFLVDAGIKPSKEKLQEAFNKIGPSPLKCVVNTHWHWDHTDGNEWLQCSRGHDRRPDTYAEASFRDHSRR